MFKRQDDLTVNLTVETPGPIQIQDHTSPNYRVYRVRVRLPE